MTRYQCDECDREFPGGAAGSSFLVLPNGRTFHLCTGACLCAHVNSIPRTIRDWGRYFVGGAGMGLAFGIAIAATLLGK